MSMKKEEFLVKFLTLGNSGVGKTSLLYRYMDGTFQNQFKATIGIDFRDKIMIHKFKDSEDSQKVHLQIWDTAGQEKFRSLTATFYRDAMGFLIVFDVTNEQSFLDVRSWIEELKTHAYCEEPDIVLCGNKVDMVDERVVSEERALEFAAQYGFQYIETSASSGENVEEAVSSLLDVVLRRVESAIDASVNKHRESESSERKLDISESGEKGSSSCAC